MTACGTNTRPVFVPPPAALLADCAETDIPLQVNRDLVYKVRSLRTDLKFCNRDKADLRAWVERMKP